MAHSVEPLRMSCARKSRPINVSISNWRRFNFGNRSVPPATNIARGPNSTAIAAASRGDFGRRYLRRGSRSMKVFRWRLDLDGRRIRDLRKARRAVSSRLTFVFAAQRLDHLLRRHGNLVDPDAERIVHRGADSGWHRQERSLARLLSAIWTFGIHGLDDERLDLGHVEEGRRLVLQHRRPLV